MISNIKMRKKFYLIIVPFMFLVICCILFSSIRQNQIMNESEAFFYDELYKVNNELVNADRDFYQANLAETIYYYHADKLTDDEKKTQLADYDENQQQVADRLDNVTGIVSKDAELYNSFTTDGSATFSEMVSGFEKSFSSWKAAYDPATGEGDFDSQVVLFDQTRDYLNSMEDLMDAYATQKTASIDAQIRTGIIAFILVIAAAFVVISIIALLVSKYITSGISNVTATIDTLSKNDLSVHKAASSSHDEIGILSRAAKTMEESLSKIVVTLKELTDKLTESNNVMKTGTEEADESMNSIQTAASELANTATQQANDTEQIANQMMDLKTVMEKSMGSTSALGEASNTIDLVTTDGMKVVEELTVITDQSMEAFQKIFDVIDRVNDSTKKINEASDMISSIAGQTNLLSLNASIEAARAGDAGKGFAVVAEEIRKLSDQSAESVSTINSMLNELKTNSDQATEQTALVREFVNKQGSSVSHTKDRFMDIVSSINSIEQEIGTLNAVNRELGEGIKNISDVVSSLSAASEENAATAEELSATTEVVSESVKSIRETGSEINKSSEELNAIISKFKI